MGVLQAFERRLGGLIEGTFAKVFKGDVQPVEIAGALTREADDKRTVAPKGRIVVPNDYVVELGDHDYPRLAEWERELTAELATMVTEHAAERGYTLVGRVHVGFDHMPDVDTGTFRVRSGVGSAGVTETRTTLGTAAASDRAAAGPGPADAYPGRPRVVVTCGGTAAAGSPQSRGEDTVYFLTHAVTVIGRAADCDLSLDDPGVSRRHAELRVSGGEVDIVDLGSTNGIRRNGHRVSRAQLVEGDRVELGSTALVFQRDRS